MDAGKPVALGMLTVVLTALMAHCMMPLLLRENLGTLFFLPFLAAPLVGGSVAGWMHDQHPPSLCAPLLVGGVAGAMGALLAAVSLSFLAILYDPARLGYGDQFGIVIVFWAFSAPIAFVIAGTAGVLADWIRPHVHSRGPILTEG